MVTGEEVVVRKLYSSAATWGSENAAGGSETGRMDKIKMTDAAVVTTAH